MQTDDISAAMTFIAAIGNRETKDTHSFQYLQAKLDSPSTN